MGLILDSSVVIAAAEFPYQVMKRKQERDAAHDAWFRAKVQESLNDPRPAIPHKKVEAHFAEKREETPRCAGAR